MSAAREAVARARRLVVKIGSRALASDGQMYARLASAVAGLHVEGRKVLVVSSGAIALGANRLGYRERPKEMARLQAAAAAGQSLLMHAYQTAFDEHGISVAQVLLTHADLSDRTRANNARAALAELLDARAVPILNENDSVSVEEIKFGDNDQLAAMVAPLVDADLLVLLSDVEGLLDASGARVAEVNDVLTEALPLVGAGRVVKSGVGTGGMASKLEAARRATMAGAHVVIADARNPGILVDIAAGKDVGTLFVPPKTRLSAKKHWIAFTLRPRGDLVLDAGAVSAVKREGKSLLPVGILGVRGDFKTGDAVRLLDASAEGSAREIGRGLSRVAAVDALRVCGQVTDEAAEVLVHRDDLVVW
jgi:glutamate 5-kinase